MTDSPWPAEIAAVRQAATEHGDQSPQYLRARATLRDAQGLPDLAVLDRTQADMRDLARERGDRSEEEPQPPELDPEVDERIDRLYVANLRDKQRAADPAGAAWLGREIDRVIDRLPRRPTEDRTPEQQREPG